MSLGVVAICVVVVGGAAKLLAVLCRRPSPLQVSDRWLDEHVRDQE
jgi:hypothetical protein